MFIWDTMYNFQTIKKDGDIKRVETYKYLKSIFHQIGTFKYQKRNNVCRESNANIKVKNSDT